MTVRKLVVNLLGVFVLSLTSSKALAIFNGSETVKEDYQNHFVRFVAKGNQGVQHKNCGGMLVGGKYLLTAHHCADGSYIPDLVIYQGIDRNNPDERYVREADIVHSRTHEAGLEWNTYRSKIFNDEIWPRYESSFEGDKSDGQSAAYWLDIFEREPVYLESRPEDQKNNPAHNAHNNSDFAMLVLNEPIPHHGGAILSPLVDLDTGERFFNPGEPFTFYGWGSTGYGGASDPIATALMQAEFELYREYPLTQARDGNYGGLRGPLCSAESDGCRFRASARVDFIGIDTGLGVPGVGPGDSGSPIIAGDYYYGSLFGADNDPTGDAWIAAFSSIGWMMPSIARAIDGVIYPSDIGISLERGSDEAHEIKIPVQNFTDTIMVLDPVVVSGGFEPEEDSGVVYDDFLVVTEGCAGLLEPQQGCMVKLLLNRNQYLEFEEQVNAQIDLGIEGVGFQSFTVRILPTFCEQNPYDPSCMDFCDLNPWHQDCMDTCDWNPWQPECMDVCEYDPWAPECICETMPEHTDCTGGDSQSPEGDGGSGDGGSSDAQAESSSGGSVSFGLIILLGLLGLRRRGLFS
ncbi:trypsin-like serine protease [Vibrio breoganii]